MKESFHFLASFLVLLSMTNRVEVATKHRHQIVQPWSGRAVRIVNEFAEVVRQLPECEARLEVVKYNRTFPFVNFEFVIHDKKVMNYKVWVDGYEKYGMEHIYSRSALSFHGSFCDIFGSSFFFLTSPLRNFANNWPTKCPFNVGQLYYLRNFYFDEKSTPPTFPGSKWRFDTQIGPEGKKDTNKTALIQYYCKIEWYDRKNTTRSLTARNKS